LVQVYEGCRVTVFEPGSRRMLLQSLISKYDVKKNVVQIVDRFPERLIDVQKTVIKERTAAAAASAAVAAQDGAGAALVSGKVSGEKAGEAAALEEAPGVVYAIPWMDYLARSMPLCVAAGGLESRDMRFLLENCLRIPPSGNVPGPRPAGRPRVLLEASPDEGFPPDVVSVQLIVPASSVAKMPQHQPPAGDPRLPAGTATSGRAGGAGDAAAPESRLLSASESLLDRPMPVVGLQHRGAGAVGGGAARGVGAEGHGGAVGGAAAAQSHVARVEVIGVWRKEWPPRGQVRAVRGSGEEVRCQYHRVQGMVSPACPPGPCAFSQVLRVYIIYIMCMDLWFMYVSKYLCCASRREFMYIRSAPRRLEEKGSRMFYYQKRIFYYESRGCAARRERAVAQTQASNTSGRGR